MDSKETLAPRYRTPIHSEEAYGWPETKAFFERLGIPWELRTLGLTIEFPSLDEAVGSYVLVSQKFQAVDMNKGAAQL